MDVKHHGKSYSTTSKAYKNFMEALVRRKVPNPGLHASFYFDVFYLRSLNISRASVVSRKLIDPGKERAFSDWREQQRELNLLEINSPGPSLKSVEYIPGRLTLKYINSMSVSSELLVTRPDLDVAVQGLQEQIDSMRVMLGAFMNDYFERYPPNTPERMELLKQNLKAGRVYIPTDIERRKLFKL